MKTTILFALVLTLFISCKPNEDSGQLADPEMQTQSELFIEQMQGEYQSCMISPGYGLPYYAQISVSVVGSVMTKNFTLSNNADCSSPVYNYEIVSEISLASQLSESPLKVAVDLKIVSYKFTDLHGWYSLQNYCGLTDWAFGVERDVTGLNCPSLNSSPAGSTYLSAGDIDYESVIIGTSSLSIIADENETGLSDLTRKLTGLAEITKI
jgi:hypothetical protein